MPSSYHLFELTEFPSVEIGNVIHAPFQHALPGEEDPPKTEFLSERSIAELEALLFRCVYESLVNRPGRAKKVAFDYYTERDNFVAYYFPQRNLMVIKARKDSAEGAMKRMFDHPGVKGNQNLIQLDSIKNRLHKLKGAYLTVDGNDDVSTVAIFGSNIDNDDRFDKAAAEGKMYYVNTMYTFEDVPILIGLTESCGVVIYQSVLDEQSELRLVLEIKDTIFDQAKPKE